MFLLVHDLLLIHDVGLHSLFGLFNCRLQTPFNEIKIEIKNMKQEMDGKQHNKNSHIMEGRCVPIKHNNAQENGITLSLTPEG